MDTAAEMHGTLFMTQSIVSWNGGVPTPDSPSSGDPELDLQGHEVNCRRAITRFEQEGDDATRLTHIS